MDRRADIHLAGQMLVPTTGLLSQATHATYGYITTLQAGARSTSLTLDFGKLAQGTRDSISARFYTITITMANNTGRDKSEEQNELQKRFNMFLHLPSTSHTIQEINEDPDTGTHLSFQNLLTEAPKRWTLYPPLIMLPPGSFSVGWTRLLAVSFRGDTDFLWLDILKAFSTERVRYTHIAVNKGIPLDNADAASNIIRAPSSELQHLCGNFGPDIEASRFYLPPDSQELIGQEDFEDAFWVKSRQNGLVQCWAPRWTMFSRGNVKEKARVLGFEKAWSYTRDGKREAAMRPATLAQNRVVSGLRGRQTPGFSRKGAVVVDSPSDGQSSSVGIDFASERLPSPRHAPKAPSCLRVPDAIDLTSSLDAPPKSTTEKEPSANPKAQPCGIPDLTPRADVGLHIDGDAPSDRPLPRTPQIHKDNPQPQPSMPIPKLDARGKPKFQEVQLAIDMYAGIGYFTFSYLKLGYDVIAYELNPFSVEGLRRGAKANGFGCTVLRGEELVRVTGEERKRGMNRDVRWGRRRSVVGEDRRDPIVIVDWKGAETIVDEGYEGQLNGWEKEGKGGNGEVGGGDGDDGDATLMDYTPDRVFDREDAVAACKISNENEPIIIDDDTSVFVEQSIQAPTTRNFPNKKTNKPVKIRPTHTSKSPSLPPKPTAPITLQSLESKLQNQFQRPSQVLVYEQNNAAAYTNFIDLTTQSSHRGGQPYKIRHINLGFLPSSSPSWDTAAALLMTNIEGGYIHVHENVGVDDIEEHKERVRKSFEELCNSYYGERTTERRVEVVHTEMVKSYAPGVWHVVYDVLVGSKMWQSVEEKRDRGVDARYHDGACDDRYDDDTFGSVDELVFGGEKE